MNDDTEPRLHGPSADGTDDEWDDETLRELRSVPHDMDELFARRAITAAIGSVIPDPESSSTGSTGSQRSRSGRSPRRLVTLGAAAAVLLVVLVVAVSTRFPRDGSSFVTADRAADASDTSADALESAGTRPEGGRSAGTAGRAGTSHALPHPGYLGRFDDVDDLIDRSIEASRSTTRTSPDVAMDDRAETSPSDSSQEEGVTECADRLRARGLVVIGWAVLEDRRVVVVEDSTPGTVQVFDAITCTA